MHLQFIAGLQRAPLGIITLEDVLEELIGEEILDEFDLKGPNALPASSYVPAEAQRAVDAAAAEKKTRDDSNAKTAKSALGLQVGTGAHNITPNASTTNLRVAQGLRAIRLATGTVAASIPSRQAKRSSSLPGTKGNAMSPLSSSVAGRGGSSNASPAGGAVLDLPVVTSDSQVDPTIATTAVSILPEPAAPAQPIIPSHGLPPSVLPLGGGGTATPIPGTPKKRAFKSLIAGEGATPGLEKRSDPMLKEGGAKGE